MPEKIITLYCVCADFLAAYGYRDDPQTHMSTAEVMTVVLVAAMFFVGNQELSRRFLKEHGYMPNTLSKSQINRRLHALPNTLWKALLAAKSMPTLPTPIIWLKICCETRPICN